MSATFLVVLAFKSNLIFIYTCVKAWFLQTKLFLQVKKSNNKIKQLFWKKKCMLKKNIVRIFKCHIPFYVYVKHDPKIFCIFNQLSFTSVEYYIYCHVNIEIIQVTVSEAVIINCYILFNYYVVNFVSWYVFLGGSPTSICHFFRSSVRLFVCRAPYLRNGALSDHNFWYTYVKWWYF